MADLSVFSTTYAEARNKFLDAARAGTGSATKVGMRLLSRLALQFLDPGRLFVYQSQEGGHGGGVDRCDVGAVCPMRRVKAAVGFDNTKVALLDGTLRACGE